MLHKFEQDYLGLIWQILETGEWRKGRNGRTKAIFGATLDINMRDSQEFPLLLSRKMFPNGIIGEMAAFLKGPKNVGDFEKEGCNYWKLWQDNEDGDITVDYGNKWLDFGGVNQLEMLIDGLRTKPFDRRHIISGWDPSALQSLSLPCCHLLYQWYVTEDGYLDMIWYQRSADTLIGIPSDIVLAAVFNILVANETGYKPGKIKMVFGDTHIYEEHIEGAGTLLERNKIIEEMSYPIWSLADGTNISNFNVNCLSIWGYVPLPTIKFELKA